ncbi:MAG TPA: hypothetical protein DDX54_05125 [Rhodospirillaceae bacterium]|nr:hypothetical protein [Rhodospirillaceae bacterium]
MPLLNRFGHGAVLGHRLLRRQAAIAREQPPAVGGQEALGQGDRARALPGEGAGEGVRVGLRQGRVIADMRYI